MKAATVQFFGGALVGALMLGAAVTAPVACNSASSPLFGRIEQVVLNDIEAGKTDLEIERDVADVLGLLDAGIVPEIAVTLVIDATQILIDTGLIPAHVFGQTRALHDRELSKFQMIHGGR